MQKKFLSIVETLKEFCTILLVQGKKIYTEHKILMWKNFNTDILLWWRLILYEYGLCIEYFNGMKDIPSDVLSLLPNNKNQEITHESRYKIENI